MKESHFTWFYKQRRWRTESINAIKNTWTKFPYLEKKLWLKKTDKYEISFVNLSWRSANQQICYGFKVRINQPNVKRWNCSYKCLKVNRWKFPPNCLRRNCLKRWKCPQNCFKRWKCPQNCFKRWNSLQNFWKSIPDRALVKQL